MYSAIPKEDQNTKMEQNRALLALQLDIYGLPKHILRIRSLGRYFKTIKQGKGKEY